MEALLKDKKLRVTAFRLSVLEIFQSQSHALRVEQIESELGEFDRITLYRTIKLFLEKGLIHEITISGDAKKYALCSTQCGDEKHEHNHIHFLCNSCGETFCLELKKMPKVEHESFKIQTMDIQTTGQCANCL